MFDDHKTFISKNYAINDVIMTIISEYITSKVNYLPSYRDIKILIDCALQKNTIFELLCLVVGNVFVGKYSYVENFPCCLGVYSNISKFVSYIITTYNCLPEYYTVCRLVESFIEEKSSNTHINDFLNYCNDYSKKMLLTELRSNINNPTDSTNSIPTCNSETKLQVENSNITNNIENYSLPTKQIRIHLLSENLICQYLVSKKHYKYLEKIVSNREIEHFKKHINAIRDVCEKYELYDHLMYEMLGY
jgi:hypothetical protein